MIKTKRWVIILIFVTVIAVTAVSCILIFNRKDKENNKIVENNEIGNEEKIEIEENKTYKFILDMETSDLNINWSLEGKEKEEAVLVKDLFQKIVDGEVHTPDYNFMVVGTCVLNGNKVYVIQAGVPSNMGEFFIIDISKGIDNAIVYYGGWNNIIADMIEVKDIFSEGIMINKNLIAKFVKDFYAVADISKEHIDTYYINDSKDLYYDLDGDNIEDKITIINNKNDDSVILKLNDVVFEENYYAPIELYVVDLNENDSKIELVTYDDGESGDPCYNIYTKKDSKMVNLISTGETNLRTDKQGIIIYDDAYNGVTYPEIYFTYYTICNETVEEKYNTFYNVSLDTELNDIEENTFINYGWFFSEEYENLENYDFEEIMSLVRKEISITKGNVEMLNKNKPFRVLEIARNGECIEYIKIKLSDGRIGYATYIQLAG